MGKTADCQELALSKHNRLWQTLLHFQMEQILLHELRNASRVIRIATQRSMGSTRLTSMFKTLGGRGEGRYNWQQTLVIRIAAMALGGDFRAGTPFLDTAVKMKLRSRIRSSEANASAPNTWALSPKNETFIIKSGSPLSSSEANCTSRHFRIASTRVTRIANAL